MLNLHRDSSNYYYGSEPESYNPHHDYSNNLLLPDPVVLATISKMQHEHPVLLPPSGPHYAAEHPVVPHVIGGCALPLDINYEYNPTNYYTHHDYYQTPPPAKRYNVNYPMKRPVIPLTGPSLGLGSDPLLYEANLKELEAAIVAYLLVRAPETIVTLDELEINENVGWVLQRKFGTVPLWQLIKQLPNTLEQQELADRRWRVWLKKQNVRNQHLCSPNQANIGRNFETPPLTTNFETPPLASSLKVVKKVPAIETIPKKGSTEYECMIEELETTILSYLSMCDPEHVVTIDELCMNGCISTIWRKFGRVPLWQLIKQMTNKLEQKQMLDQRWRVWMKEMN